MKVFDNGSLFTVTVFQREVQQFKSQWPGSGLIDKAVSFMFDKQTGDLVEIFGKQADGPALAALSIDAMNYGIDRLALPKTLKRK